MDDFGTGYSSLSHHPADTNMPNDMAGPEAELAEIARLPEGRRARVVG